MINRFEEPVKVLFHLNEGFTKVLFEGILGVGLANGAIDLDIPTEKIPLHLRKIGSRFVLVGNYKEKESLMVKELS